MNPSRSLSARSVQVDGSYCEFSGLLLGLVGSDPYWISTASLTPSASVSVGWLALGEGDALGVADADCVALGEGDALAVADADAVALGERLGLARGV
jgi:hypothetical protein